MKKFFVNFSITNHMFAWVILEDCSDNYFVIKKNTITPKNIEDIYIELAKVNDFINKLSTRKDIIVNVIFDDDQLQNLSLQITHTQVSKIIKKKVISSVSTELEDIINNYYNINKIHVLSKQTYHYSTINDGQIKEYLEFPINKNASKLKAKTATFYLKDNNQELEDIKTLFSKYFFKNVNYFTKSTTLASYLKNYDDYNLLIDLNNNYLVIAICFNGVIVKYQKILVGTSKFYNFIAKKTNLSQKDVKNRVMFLINKNFSCDFNDEILDFISQNLQTFTESLKNQVNTFIDTSINKDTTKLTFNKIVFSGALANYWSKNFSFENYKYKSKEILSPDKNMLLFRFNNLEIMGAVNLTNNHKQEDQSQIDTLTSYFAIDQKKSFFKKIKHIITNIIEH